jgi:hypothetical protein
MNAPPGNRPTFRPLRSARYKLWEKEAKKQRLTLAGKTEKVKEMILDGKVRKQFIFDGFVDARNRLKLWPFTAKSG